MIPRSIFATFCGGPLLMIAFATSACGSQQNTQGQQQAQSTDRNVPTLDGKAVEVCGDLSTQGVVAAKKTIAGGVAFEIASLDEDAQETISERVETAVSARQDLERAFAEVRTSKHNDGNGVYVLFSHEDADVLDGVQAIVEHGIRQNAQAQRRVNVTREDGDLRMQLPKGGALITSKTDSAADDTVKKWNDRTPTELATEQSEHGVRIEVQALEDERLAEIEENFISSLLGCD